MILSQPGAEVLAGRRRLVTGTFFVVMGAALLVMMAGLVDTLLPAGIAGRVSRNSEAVCFVLLLSAWLLIGLPRYRSGGVRWLPVTVALALVAVGVGLGLSSLPSSIRTVNESLFAVAVLIPYVSMKRPLPQWVPFVALLVPLAAVVIGVVLARPESGQPLEQSNVVIQILETLVLVALVVVGLDLVDRGILDASAKTRRSVRWAFYAVLIGVPLGVIALGDGDRVGADFASLTLNVLGRSHEAFLGTLLICLFFAVGLGRVGASDTGPRQ